MGYSATVLADSPVLFCTFEETSGTVVNDLSTNAASGIYTGGTPTRGASGVNDSSSVTTLCYTYTGTNGQVQFADAAQFAPTGTDWTVELWMKSTDAGADLRAVGRYDSANSPFSGYIVGLASGKVEVWDGTGSMLNSTSTINDGAWHHVVVTFHFTGGSSYAVTIYLDGTSNTSTTRASSLKPTGTHPLYIGRSEYSADFYIGSIDNVALYNTALSGTQVANHYNATMTDTFPYAECRAYGMSGITGM